MDRRFSPLEYKWRDRGGRGPSVLRHQDQSGAGQEAGAEEIEENSPPQRCEAKQEEEDYQANFGVITVININYHVSSIPTINRQKQTHFYDYDRWLTAQAVFMCLLRLPICVNRAPQPWHS